MLHRNYYSLAPERYIKYLQYTRIEISPFAAVGAT